MNAHPLPFPFRAQQFHFNGHGVTLYLPQAAAVYQAYVHNATTATPYWSRLWPAAVGLCTFLAANPTWVQNKNVVELAAGLGLPSLLAAQWATTVLSTDIDARACAFIAASAKANHITNLSATVLDWAGLGDMDTPDVVLLSDVNYDPAAFSVLLAQIKQVLGKGSTIVLSTPQRLMAKAFIETVLPWCIASQQVPVVLEDKPTVISIYVLQQSSDRPGLMPGL